MNNSLVLHLTGYVDALFKDLAPMYSKARECQRDKTRLTRELAIHGKRLFTIDLPALSKHFEKCLDEGQYSSSGLPYGRLAPKAKVPLLLKDLYLQVFDNEGKLRLSPNVNAILAIRQALRCLSKEKDICQRGRIVDEVRNFRTIESTLRVPTLSWSGQDLLDGFNSRLRSSRHLVSFSDGWRLDEEIALFEDPKWRDLSRPLSRPLTDVLSAVCDRIVSQFGDLHSEESYELPKHGPGRVSNHPRGISKYSFTEWPAKLDQVFPHDLYARTDFGLGSDRERDRAVVSLKETPAKLIAVPKTQSGPRLIASEPNQYQWIQQLIRNQLEARIKRTDLRHCVSFGDQGPNQELARTSSADGFYATVDLKSASDRLSLWTVERAFRSNLTILERLHASRSRVLSNCIDPFQWDYIILRKATTQGSACTFPVQTIVFAMFAIAATIFSDGDKVTSSSIRKASKAIRVFGDDIIVKTTALETLRDILRANQLEVNTTKTFSKGKFRESCGYDAYDGVNVTPSYIRTISLRPDHEKLQSVISCANNLHRNGWWHLAKWLDGTYRRYQKYIPIDLCPSGETWSDKCFRGLPVARVSFTGRSTEHLKSRYSDKLHREEIYSLKLVSKPKTVRPAGSHSLFQYFIERPSPFTKWEGVTVTGSSAVMRRGWNPIA